MATPFIIGLCCDGCRCTEDEMERYAMHLLVLSHVFRVPALKRACVGMLADRLDVDLVVDVLQLARLCDAPRLYVRCMKLLAAEFGAVEQTEGWRFLQTNDPWLELEILQALHEADLVSCHGSGKSLAAAASFSANTGHWILRSHCPFF